ncbi:isoprenylcysteine carboxylmethyltransferase family protein [Massilia terrae]|uniref:Isoprenylcysteine carboxylmethyltransferase family protein n=1 Tax=Massilia terrae TaxID=1811224 RepID=A0ABT2CS36_9BURK|nr:isoprenylcysteine carboxylmethyltransferase family protein [Massilia terrae]MCS0656769.1 isoprenylcysteine carboxylmethyltransferase family protein [Massilia terrae]
MTPDNAPAYGLWGLVVVNSLVFIIFAFSFARPQTRRDWRSFSAFSAFLVALFTEMYGFPLTIYLLLPWLTRHFPGVDFLSHDAGHLFETVTGIQVNPHFGALHIASDLLIVLGFMLLASAWDGLYKAQRAHTLATAGPYAKVRHPQYVGFVIIMFGFLLQWPTIVTLILFPILVGMYVHLARVEEHESIAAFGDTYRRYVKEVPSFFPRFRHLSGSPDKVGRERHG